MMSKDEWVRQLKAKYAAAATQQERDAAMLAYAKYLGLASTKYETYVPCGCIPLALPWRKTNDKRFFKVHR